MNVAIGLPVHGAAHRRHEQCLAELRRAEPSWLGISLPNSSHIELARTAIAEETIRRKVDLLLWIDADITFTVETARAIVRAAAEHHAIVGCLYAQKAFGGAPVFDFAKKGVMPCIKGGGLVDVRALGFGLLAHPVSVLERIATHFNMEPLRLRRPEERGRRWFSSWEPGWKELMGEDYAFCRRAREAGVAVLADTRQRIGHLGEHEYHLEDGNPATVPLRYECVELEPTWLHAWEEPES